MQSVPTILYLCFSDTPVQSMKLAGVRRYAATRGWEVVDVPKTESGPERIPALLARHRPVGCVIDCCGNKSRLGPALFGLVPAVWLDAPKDAKAGTAVSPSVSVDEAAVARTALRELSANLPKSFAAVEFQFEPYQRLQKWSHDRARAFRAFASATGRSCDVFKSRANESPDNRAVRLQDWLSRLPRPCGVFAVNDGTGFQVRAACRAAGLSVPRDISIVGVDNDVSLCEAAVPTLSSIQIDFERAGYVAANMLAATMKSRAPHEVKGRASHEMKGRAPHEMMGATRVANGWSSPFALEAHPPFGGKAATRHCGEAAPSLPPKAALSFDQQRPDGGITVIGPLLVVRRTSTGGRGRREPRILEAVEMIRREACDGLTAAQLAARFAGTRRLFDLRFREATGHSVLDEILHVRLERAFTLLAETDTAIGAIYAFCGFRSGRALDFLFRTRFGMSMREWRKRNRKK